MLFFSPQKAEAVLEKNKLVIIQIKNLPLIKKKELIAPYCRSTVNQLNYPIAAISSASCLFLRITSSSLKTGSTFHSTPNFALQIPKCSATFK